MTHQNTLHNREPLSIEEIMKDEIFKRIADAGGTSVSKVIDLCRQTEPQILRANSRAR